MTEAQLKKLTGLLGLCVRARQATFGMDGCLKAVRGGQCAALLLDGGASAGTADKYAQACATHQVLLVSLPEGLLGAATGKPGVAMAIAQGGLAKQLLLILEPTGQEECHTNTENQCGGASVE